MSAPTSRASLALIAEALRRIADMMAADREMMAHARHEAAEYVDPAECQHPKAYRVSNKTGAQITIGCQLCEAKDITKARRSA